MRLVVPRAYLEISAIEVKAGRAPAVTNHRRRKSARLSQWKLGREGGVLDLAGSWGRKCLYSDS